MADPSRTTCPLCAERVSGQGVKCKHCGSSLRPSEGELGAALTADLAPTAELGPVGIFVGVGLFLGFVVGAAFGGGWHSLSVVVGGILGAITFSIVDSLPAEAHGSGSSSEPLPGSPPEEELAGEAAPDVARGEVAQEGESQSR